MRPEQAHCPNCQAEIEPDLIASTGSDECPFCGADVSALLPAEIPRELSSPPVSDFSSRSFSNSSADSSTLNESIPTGSEIQVLEASPDRYVLHIPPGKHGVKGMGCFAFLWNAIVVGVSVPFIMELLDGKPAFEELGAVLIISIFWLIGVGMAYFWLKMKYTRVNMLLDHDRIAVQKIFFNSKKMATAILTKKSRAELVESYSENDNPVYAVSVAGEGDKISFGVALKPEEKDWLVDSINNFLGVSSSPEKVEIPNRCPNCDAQLDNVTMDTKTGEMICPKCEHLLAETQVNSSTAVEYEVEPLDPREVTPAGSLIIHDETGINLKLTYNIIKSFGCQTGCAMILGFIGVIWITIAGVGIAANVGQLNINNIVQILFGLAFSFPALAFIVSGIAIKRGKIVVDLNDQQLQVKWGWSFLRLKKTIPSQEISSIKIMTGSNFQKQRASTNRKRADRQQVRLTNIPVCVVQSKSRTLVITTNHDLDLVKQVAGMLSYQLRQMGVQLDE